MICASEISNYVKNSPYFLEQKYYTGERRGQVIQIRMGLQIGAKGNMLDNLHAKEQLWTWSENRTI